MVKERCSDLSWPKTVRKRKMETDELQGSANKLRGYEKRRKYNEMDPITQKLLYLTSQSLEEVQHSYMPSFNVSQQPLETCEDLRSCQTLSFAAPRLAYVAPYQCDPLDICHRRSFELKSYVRRMEAMRTRYQTTLKASRKLIKAEEQDIYHNLVYECAERLHCHPHKYFKGHYDYYYTGGSLCLLPQTGHMLLASGTNMDTLNVGRASRKMATAQVLLRNASSMHFGKDKSEIFEVRPWLSTLDDNSNCFAVRQRNRITICVLTEELEIEPVFTLNNKAVPFITFAQSVSERHKLIVCSMNEWVELYDVPSCSLVNVYKPNEDGSHCKWNTIRTCGNHTFLYANQQQLSIMDVRTPPEEWIRITCGHAPDEIGCEQISSLSTSSYKHLFYVGTAHKLHCLDVRRLGSHFEAPRGAVCRWAHQLEYPPLLMDTFRHTGSEFIAIASALSGDMHVCELTRQTNFVAAEAENTSKPRKHVYRPLSLAYQPPTLQEAYENARLSGSCLHPDANLKNRIARCTTGLAFGGRLEDNSAHLFFSNSIGDVFAHKIAADDGEKGGPRVDEISDATMRRYEKKVCAVLQQNLNYSFIVDMKAMKKVFRCDALSSLTADVEPEATDGKPTRRRLGRWQKSLQALHGFKDVLAQDLLAIWDIDYKDEQDLKFGTLGRNFKTDPDAIVSSWLDDNLTAQAMTVIPAANLIQDPMADAEFLSTTERFEFDRNLADAPQSTQIPADSMAELDPSALDMEIDSWMPPPTTPKSLKRKCKPKYVTGF